jgi:hypothetical protein
VSAAGGGRESLRWPEFIEMTEIPPHISKIIRDSAGHRARPFLCVLEGRPTVAGERTVMAIFLAKVCRQVAKKAF